MMYVWLYLIIGAVLGTTGVIGKKLAARRGRPIRISSGMMLASAVLAWPLVLVAMWRQGS